MKRLLKQKPKRFKNTKSVIIIIIATFIVLMIVLKIEDIQTTMMFANFANKQLDNQNQLMQQIMQQNQQLIDQNSNLKKQVSLPMKEKVASYVGELWGVRAKEAMTIISCENSAMTMDHVNHNKDGTFDSGPFQINSLHASRFGKDFMTDWKANVRVAYALFKEQDWNPWYSSKNCWQGRMASL